MQIPGARTDGAAVVAVCHQIIDGITAAHCKLDVIKNARGKRKPGEGGDAIPHPLQHLGCKSHFSFLFRGAPPSHSSPSFSRRRINNRAPFGSVKFQQRSSLATLFASTSRRAGSITLKAGRVENITSVRRRPAQPSGDVLMHSYFGQ